MAQLSCDVCGSSDSTPYSTPVDYITGERFAVVRCPHCGLVFVDSQPPLADLKRYYPSGHQQAEPAAYELMDAKARVRFVAQHVPAKPGLALDVGCGKGLLLQGLRERGWQVYGTELSEISSSHARSKGLTVYTSMVEEAPFEAGSFDLITLFHVLEHLPQPKNTISVLFTLLRPGGSLLIEVPNIGSWYAKFFGDDWFHYDVPRHLFHFNPKTLRQLIGNAGFVITRTDTHNIQYDAFGAVQSFLNRLLNKPNLLNNFNTKQITFSELWSGEDRISSVIALAFSELMLVIGFPLMALVGLLLSPWVNGGTLRMLAKKPD